MLTHNANFFQRLLSVCTLTDIQKLLCSLIYTTVFSAPVIRLHPFGYSEVTLFTHIYNCFFSTCYPFAPFRIFRSYSVHSYIQLFFQHLLSVCTLTDIQKETHISTSAANAKESTFQEEGWDSFKNDTESFMYVKTINICLLKAFSSFVLR